MTFHVLLGRAAAVAVAAGLLAPPAFANILATATRANNFTSASASVAVPLSDGGATSLSFTTTKANQLVRIIYNAECGVVGPANAWQSVAVTVDGVAAAPASGTQFALCTATSTTNYVWIAAVRQSVIRVATPGLHSLAVTASLNNGATSLWLGDTSVVIDTQ